MITRVGSGFDAISDLVPGPGDHFVAVGQAVADGRDRFALARFDRRGKPDAMFGNGGTVVVPTSAPYAYGAAGARLPDGRVVAVGASGSNSAVESLRFSGTPVGYSGGAERAVDPPGRRLLLLRQRRRRAVRRARAVGGRRHRAGRQPGDGARAHERERLARPLLGRRRRRAGARARRDGRHRRPARPRGPRGRRRPRECGRRLPVRARALRRRRRARPRLRRRRRAHELPGRDRGARDGASPARPTASSWWPASRARRDTACSATAAPRGSRSPATRSRPRAPRARPAGARRRDRRAAGRRSSRCRRS